MRNDEQRVHAALKLLSGTHGPNIVTAMKRADPDASYEAMAAADTYLLDLLNRIRDILIGD